jgi:hypothetical protein
MDKLRKFESIIGDGEPLLRFSVSFPLSLLLVNLPRKLQLLQQYFTILSPSSACQPSQKASATPTIFYDSLSFFCLSTFPESFSYSNNILPILSLSSACQPSQKASATPTLFSLRRLSIPQTAAAAASRVQFASVLTTFLRVNHERAQFASVWTTFLRVNRERAQFASVWTTFLRVNRERALLHHPWARGFFSRILIPPGSGYLTTARQENRRFRAFVRGKEANRNLRPMPCQLVP